CRLLGNCVLERRGTLNSETHRGKERNSCLSMIIPNVFVPSSASFAALRSRLSKLHPAAAGGQPPCLKYQLPHEDLDALVSVTSDEDFDNMFDEYDRFALADRDRSEASSTVSEVPDNLFGVDANSGDTPPIEPKVEPASQPSVPPVLDLPPVKTKMDVEQVQSITIEPITLLG
ncbi:unnamed protein product, partial [Musa acuminata subsp. burmannicoides]